MTNNFNKKDRPTIRDLEKVLREAGLSGKEARRVLAVGYHPDVREAHKDEAGGLREAGGRPEGWWYFLARRVVRWLET